MKVRRIVAAGAAAFAACGVLGMAPAAVQASSAPDATWTIQQPAVRPPVRDGAAMAYDAATGTAVLFGGFKTARGGGHFHTFADTWTWDGTTWTQQHPTVHPTAREGAAMAYDAATGTVVLFGGRGPDGHNFGSTWTWDGTTWTRQAPAVHPPARFGASMAYDKATGTIVLFGGNSSHLFADTWTWDGTAWTRQAPATTPPFRAWASMAYDAATGTAVLFGGEGSGGLLGDTWTWDGTTWTRQGPATSPPARYLASMAYDAANRTAVLFSGDINLRNNQVADTWTWDGTTWRQQAPAVHPLARADASMAYDAATGTVVLFGGVSRVTSYYLHDTWTWS